MLAAALILAVSIIPLADAPDCDADPTGDITLHFYESFGTGLNNYGQLGNGSTSNLQNFDALDFDDAVAIYPSSETVYYLTSDGRLFGSGHNDCGQLGTGDTVDRHEPVRIGAGLGIVVYVACGRCDGYFEYGMKPYDVAAGAFIIQQAGGQVSDFSGGNNWLFGGEIIASGPDLFPEFQQSIKHFLIDNPE